MTHRLASLQVLGLCLCLALASTASAFGTNGRQWPNMPIPYYVNESACPDLPDGLTFTEILRQATATWEAVSCANVQFIYQGPTEAVWAADDQNTFFCIGEGWAFGPGSAGATLWIPKEEGEPMEADIAINADSLTWVVGGPDATRTDAIDPLGVMTHELGHFLGLAHTPEPFATMYYGQLPNGMNSTLDADDRAGICSIYPSGQMECANDTDCDERQHCGDISDIPVCIDEHDGPGAFCSKDYIDCEGMCWVSFYECSQLCLFTTLDFTEGYCAPLCGETACPTGFVCQYVESHDVDICFIDPDPTDGGTEDGNDGGLADAGGDERSDASTEDAGLQDAAPADAGESDEQDSGCGCAASPGSPAISSIMLPLLFAWIRKRRS